MDRDEQAAGLLSGASQMGQRDPQSSFLTGLAHEGVGPLAGIFAGLGAALAGRDADFAAGQAMAGARQAQEERRRRMAEEHMKQQQILNNRFQAVQLAASTGAMNAKQLRSMVNPLLLEVGITPTLETVDVVLKKPSVLAMLNTGKVPSPTESASYMQFRQENPDIPPDHPMIAMADQRLAQMLEIKDVKATVPPIGDEMSAALFTNVSKEQQTALGKLPPEQAFEAYRAIEPKPGGDVAIQTPELAKQMAEQLGRIGNLNPTQVEALSEDLLGLGKDAGLVFERLVQSYKSIADDQWAADFALRVRDNQEIGADEKLRFKQMVGKNAESMVKAATEATLLIDSGELDPEMEAMMSDLVHAMRLPLTEQLDILNTINIQDVNESGMAFDQTLDTLIRNQRGE